MISGTPTEGGSSSVTVTVDDGLDQASTTFSWDISAIDTAAPSTPLRPSYTVVNGSPLLSWEASTDNVGVAGYYVFRSLDRGSVGTIVGQTTDTSWLDPEAQPRDRYYYRVQAFDAAGNVSELSPYRRVFYR